MFMMVHNLCSIYKGLTPFEVEEKSYGSIIALYADVRRMQIREEKPKKDVIRRRASDDAGWW